MLDGLRVLLFRKPFCVGGRRTAKEAALLLAQLTGTPFDSKRGKLFIGSVEGDQGRLWFRRQSGHAYPARSLRFHLVPAETGCRLEGELVLITPLRLYGLIGSVLFVVGGSWLAVESLLHGGSAWLALRYLLQTALGGILFSYAYIALVVWFGRKAENLGLKVLKHLLAGDVATDVVLDLLTLSR